MSIFRGRLAKQEALYTPVDRTSPLGTIAGAPVPVFVLIDEGGAENWQSRETTHSSSVLIYVEASSPIAKRESVGGHLTTAAGRTFRLDGFDVGRNQRTGQVEHIEFTASEQT